MNYSHCSIAKLPIKIKKKEKKSGRSSVKSCSRCHHLHQHFVSHQQHSKLNLNLIFDTAQCALHLPLLYFIHIFCLSFCSVSQSPLLRLTYFQEILSYVKSISSMNSVSTTERLRLEIYEPRSKETETRKKNLFLFHFKSSSSFK